MECERERRLSQWALLELLARVKRHRAGNCKTLSDWEIPEAVKSANEIVAWLALTSPLPEPELRGALPKRE